jgi:hypothetical protein
MQVDIGTCALCGAKNSKFVESCYKCGAPLPWAPNYVAMNPPQPNAQPAAPPAPKAAPPRPQTPTPAAPRATGSSTAFDQNAFDGSNGGNAFLTTIQRPVQMPMWGAASGALGALVLGFLLAKAFSKAPEPAVVVLPTPIPTVVATPLAAAAPALALTATPAATIAPTSAPTATLVPSLSPPAVSNTAAAPGSTPPALPAPAPVVAPNLSFDSVYINTHQGTPDQQKVFWNTAINGKVNWRGTLVTAPTNGSVTVRCGSGKDIATVVVNLDPSSGQIQAGLKPDQSVDVEGELQAYTPDSFVLSRGTVKP